MTFSSKAPQTALEAVRAQSTVPVESGGVLDIKSASGRGSTSAQAVCPVNGSPSIPARCGDVYPFYGGSLLHKYGSHDACSTGVNVYAGPYNYVTTAWHCGAGQWYGYDSGDYVGYANTSQVNVQHDIRVIGQGQAAKIWTGTGYTTASRYVVGAAYANEGQVVVCSCGADGNSIKAQEVALSFISYPDPDDPSIDHFPALYIKQRLGDGTGAVQEGDSGSPVIRSCSASSCGPGKAGYFQVVGFMTAVGHPFVSYGQAGRHDGFNGLFGPNWFAIEAPNALASMGLHVNVGP
jgi:hypothetical protein